MAVDRRSTQGVVEVDAVPHHAVNPNIKVVRDGQDDYRAEDRADSRFHIAGVIAHVGDYFVFRIRSRILPTKERSAISPEEFFDAMMQHFTEKGLPPVYLRGIWNNNDPEYTSNLYMFNAAVQGGDDLDRAATKTFTGKMANRWHYSVATVIRAEPQHHPGHYTDVIATFST
jgi:hypothetical protein